MQSQCGVNYVENVVKAKPELERGAEKETHAGGGDNGATSEIERDTKQHQTQTHALEVA